MSEYLIIAVASFFISIIAFYSGFGLGTLLMPVFAIFMPVEMAVAATAVVHFCNNLFKMGATWRSADVSIILRFGIPAVIAALIGAMLLGKVSGAAPIATYIIVGRVATITEVKILIAALMLFFAMFELLPYFARITFDRKYLVVGGILSGFFGGLSGHQGALRSVFLTKAGISTEAFVGTTAVISFLVDAGRLSVYAVSIFIVGRSLQFSADTIPLTLVAMFFALMGVIIGKRYLKKVKMRWVQYVTGVMLVLIAILLASGVI